MPTQPTIEQLIDDVIDKTEVMTIRVEYTPEVFQKAKAKMLTSRSALLLRIAEIEKERDDWHKMADGLGDWVTEYSACDVSPLTKRCITADLEQLTALTTRYAHPSETPKTSSEVKELRFKTSKQERFIWWIHQVYARNVQDLIAEIMTACTYQDEPTAASGKYGLPIKCFEDMERLSKYSHGIYDGTYLDVGVSTVITYLENEENTGLNLVVCHECRVVLPPQMARYQYSFCPNCGRKITEKGIEPSISDVSVTENVLPAHPSEEGKEVEG